MFFNFFSPIGFGKKSVLLRMKRSFAQNGLEIKLVVTSNGFGRDSLKVFTVDPYVTSCRVRHWINGYVLNSKVLFRYASSIVLAFMLHIANSLWICKKDYLSKSKIELFCNSLKKKIFPFKKTIFSKDCGVSIPIIFLSQSTFSASCVITGARSLTTPTPILCKYLSCRSKAFLFFGKKLFHLSAILWAALPRFSHK